MAATAMTASTTVEASAATAAEPAATRSATESAASIAATSITAAVATTIPGYATSVAVTATISIAAVAAAIAPATAEPRASANKHTAIKPSGAIISIRRARVRRVTVIAITTCGRAIVAASNSHTNRNLRVRTPRRRQEKSKHSNQC
jgi:hypothetical protein